MNQSVCLPCVIEKFIAKALTSMRAWYKSGNVYQLDWYEPIAIDAY
jgi:hypothetical protein